MSFPVLLIALSVILILSPVGFMRYPYSHAYGLIVCLCILAVCVSSIIRVARQPKHKKDIYCGAEKLEDN